MKWLSSIFGKDEIPSTVAFDGLDTWLELVSNSIFRSLSATADKLFREIADIRDRLKQDTTQLQDAEPVENMPANISKLGLVNRDKMVKQLNTLTEKISVPTQTDYKTVISFYKLTSANIESTLGKSSKSIYYVRSLFPDVVKVLVSDLKRLKTALNLLIKPIREKERHIMKLEEVPGIIQALKDLKSEIEKENANVRDQEEDCFVLESKIETEGVRLRQIEEDAEWMQLKELETELSRLEADLNVLESDVSKLFAPIKKPLTLLKKQDESGRHTLTPEERRAVSSILLSPIRALEGEINDALIAIKKVIEGEASILKDRKRDTTLKWIDHLLNAELAAIKGKRDLLQSRIKERKGKLADMTILGNKAEIEQSIASAKGQLTRFEEGVDRSKRRRDTLEEELIAKKRLLLDALEEIAGKKIDVEFEFK
ncbi:MAG: hypothetical protein U9O90_00220 [Euryarchaeota archaeon]|nr:hypothetical protein [Euryarchaeota archaeon]